MNLDEMIANVDELLRLRHESLKLLQELRQCLILAQRFGVNPNEIAKAGFDPKLTYLGGFSGFMHAHDKALQADIRELNYVVLKDGRRVELPEKWQDFRNRREYVEWRRAELRKYMNGSYQFKPDTSPSAWKRAMKKIADEKQVNAIESPATEIPNPGAAG